MYARLGAGLAVHGTQLAFCPPDRVLPDDGPNVRTLRRMRELIRDALMQQRVILTARHIVDGIPGRDQLSQARAIREWLAHHFRFIPDPLDTEALRTPDSMLVEMQTRFQVQGDCDEAAILGGAMAAAIGLPVRLEAVAFDCLNAPLSHVYAVVVGPGWQLDLDTTKGAPIIEDRISRRVTLPV